LQTIPAFGAISTFNRLRQKYPDYTYREATLNPTTPEHRATDWEVDVIGSLRDHPERKDLTGEWPTATGPSLYLATPIPADPAARSEV
jgi:protein-histidine pros-kinase